MEAKERHTKQREKTKKKYILKNDCDYEEEDELRTPVMDREGWKVIARSSRVRTA